MIKYAFLFISILFFTSCSNDDDSATPIDELIIGEWVWTESIGGTDGTTTYNPVTENYSFRLEFSDDNKVTLSKDGNVFYTTIYTIKKEESLSMNKTYNVLTIDDSEIDTTELNNIFFPMRYLIIERNDGNLYLANDTTNGFRHQFNKLEKVPY